MSRTRFLNRKKEKNINIISRLGSRPQSSFNNRAYSSKFSGGFRGRDRSLERNNFRNRSFSSRSRSGDRFSNRKRFNNEKKVFICSFCKKKGHTRKFCYQLKQNNKIYTKNQNSVKFLDTPKSPIPSTSSSIFKRLKADLESDSEDELSCLMIASGIGSKPRSNGPCYVETLIENKRLTMEVDCGSAESVISEELFFRNFKNHSLSPCHKRLVVIDGKRLKISGMFSVKVENLGIQHKLNLIVLRCDNEFTPLMGRTWLDVLYPEWRNIFARHHLFSGSVHLLKEDQAVEEIRNLARWSYSSGAQTSIEDFARFSQRKEIGTASQQF
ncbi:uncharacterized protein LOC129758223 [Uranotaenia lowii]|uniref:uncharacterized protein LOC129758223 n=1 Tax=Uranotaenia lowii TaxID=190385 RepID=UPI00247A1A3D|nr:uncharacterized protein LOC129758223 [Uranotaenia lowii]